MLHPPGASRRAPLLSVIVSTQVPSTRAFEFGAVDPDWCLIVVRHGITYGELVHAYHWHLPAWARARLYETLGVIDPAVDLAGHHRTRWWEDHWTITRATEVMVASAGAEAGLLVPLPRPPEQMAS